MKISHRITKQGNRVTEVEVRGFRFSRWQFTRGDVAWFVDDDKFTIDTCPDGMSWKEFFRQYTGLIRARDFAGL